MIMRKYSIIVVTYNNADGLKRTLQSISKLDYPSYEVIVIDGLSKDDTQSVVSSHQDIVTTFVSEKDSGIYNAMNKGIKYVNGDYVVFMNAGDIFANQGVLNVVNKYDGDIILGSETYGGEKRIVKEEMSLYDILSTGINHQAVYYRKDIIQKYGFDESYTLVADLKSVVEPLTKDHVTISCIPEILAICEGGGKSKVAWRDTLIENRRLIEELVEPFYKNDYSRFARINNDMLDDFAVLSRFPRIFPLIRCLARILRFLNDKFKHIPLD